jgi:hypothetical protein
MITKISTSKTIIWIFSIRLPESQATMKSKLSSQNRVPHGPLSTKNSGTIFQEKLMTKKEHRRQLSDYGHGQEMLTN